MKLEDEEIENNVEQPELILLDLYRFYETKTAVV